MPCGARGDAALLQHNYVGLVVFGEVIGRRAANNSTANDDNLGVRRKCHGIINPWAD